MIFHGWLKHGGPQGIAERFAGRVREFNSSHAEDAWLLAGWERKKGCSSASGLVWLSIRRSTNVAKAETMVPPPPAASEARVSGSTWRFQA